MDTLLYLNRFTLLILIYSEGGLVGRLTIKLISLTTESHELTTVYVGVLFNVRFYSASATFRLTSLPV